MDTIRKTIIDVLLEKNRLTTSEAASFDKLATNEQIEEKLRKDKLVSSEDIAKAYAIVYDLPFIRLENYEIKPEAFNLIPRDVVTQFKIVAFDRSEPKKLKIALGLPSQLKNNPPSIISELKEKGGMQINLYVTTLEDVQGVLTRFAQSNVQVAASPNPKITYPQPYGSKTIDLKSVKIPYDVISKFPIEICQKYKMLVFASPDLNSIQVAISNPNDTKVKEILDFVRNRNEIKIEEFVTPVADIENTLRLYYKKPEDVSVVVEPEIPVLLDKKEENNQVDTKEAKIEPDEGKTFGNFLNQPIFQHKTEPVDVAADKDKYERLGDKIVQRDTTGIDTTSPIHATAPTERRRFVRRPIPYEIQKDGPKAVPAATEVSVSTVISAENDLDRSLGQPVKNIETLVNVVKTGNIPQILSATIVLAVNMKASDIHIEAEGEDLRIRFRVDGVLKDILKAPLPLHAALISRIKILSRLKIDETRVPQDGRFDVKTQGHEIDLRVSTLPTVRGEKAALRILDKSQSIYTLADLGIDGRNLQLLEENIAKPYGVILSTGPTGSGKSTTLYSILKQISTPAVNVITLEDPVEYEMPGINQCQVKPKIGFSFAEGLRSVLRQDPNIIMVGEIRDSETAGMATHAALTGHLVLTTLHTNDAAGALPRLTNMGIEPFLITSSINVVVGQRLVRKICPHCKREAKIPPELMEEIEKELAQFNLPRPYVFYEGAGCDQCNNGFSGRIGIYEVLSMSEKIESLAIGRRPASEIKEAAMAEGMVTMKQDGLLKSIKGLTTISEVLRVTLTE